MKILYFTYIENPFAPENQGVMRSQVTNLLKSLSNKTDLSIHWLAIINTKIHLPKETTVALLKDELKSCNITSNFINIPNNFLTNRDSFAGKHLFSVINQFKPDIVHCRVYPTTRVALNVRHQHNLNYKVIFDARGIYPEQILERSNNFIGTIRYYWWKMLEKKMLQNSDLTIGVSEPFVEHFKRINNTSNIKFIPCCVEIDKTIVIKTSNNLKEDLGFSPDNNIIVYSGNLSAKYSSINKIVELFSKIYQLENTSSFLILTNSNTENLINLLSQHNLLDKSKILNLQPNEVPKYLSIGNVAVLFRDKSLVNEVAMPTKFAEYLSCGLPVIVSSSIKGVAKIVAENNVGIVLDDCEISKEQLSQLLAINKGTCKQAAKRFYVDLIAEQYYQEYKILYTKVL